MPGSAPGTGRLKLARSQRLKRGWEFERTRREGERLAKGCLVLNWRIVENQAFCRVGIVTSRKIGNAIVRSRARRLLREVFRLHQHEVRPPVDLVLVARRSINGRSFAEVERDFLDGLRKARLLGGKP